MQPLLHALGARVDTSFAYDRMTGHMTDSDK